jgi:hypothetical protein
MRIFIAVAVAAALTGASTPTGSPHSPEAQAKLDKLLAGRVAGETLHCVPVETTDNPIPIDDSTMLFRDGPRIWRTELQGSYNCGKISKMSQVVTESTVHRLCAGDKLVFFDNDALSGACYLGEFTPYRKP